MAVYGKLFYKETTYTPSPAILIDANSADSSSHLLRAANPSAEGGVEIVACGGVDYAYDDTVGVSENRSRVAEFYFTEFDYGPEGFVYKVSGTRGDTEYKEPERSPSTIVAGGRVFEEDTVSPGIVRDFEFTPEGTWFGKVKEGVSSSLEKAIEEADPGESVSVVLHNPSCHTAQEIRLSQDEGSRQVAYGAAYAELGGAEGGSTKECMTYDGSSTVEVCSLYAELYPWSAEACVYSYYLLMFPAVKAGASISIPTTVRVEYNARYSSGPGAFVKVSEEVTSCDNSSCTVRYDYEYQSESKTGAGREIVMTAPLEAYRLDSWCNDIGNLTCWNLIKDNSLVSTDGVVRVVVPGDGSAVEKETTVTITVPESRVVALVPCMASVYGAMREDLCDWGSGGRGTRTTYVTNYIEAEGVKEGSVCVETDSFCRLGELDIRAKVFVVMKPGMAFPS